MVVIIPYYDKGRGVWKQGDITRPHEGFVLRIYDGEGAILEEQSDDRKREPNRLKEARDGLRNDYFVKGWWEKEIKGLVVAE